MMARNSNVPGWHKGIYLSPMWARIGIWYAGSAYGLWYAGNWLFPREDPNLIIQVIAVYIIVTELIIWLLRKLAGYDITQNLFGMPPRNDYSDFMKTRDDYLKKNKSKSGSSSIEEREAELLRELEEIKRMKE